MRWARTSCRKTGEEESESIDDDDGDGAIVAMVTVEGEGMEGQVGVISGI